MARDFYLSFQIFESEIHPRKISERLDVQPDTEFGKGERRPELNLPRRNIWAVRSKSQSDEVRDHWTEIVDVVGADATTMRNIVGLAQFRITIVVQTQCRIPSLQIPVEMSAYAAEIGAMINIDHLQ